MFSLLTRIPVLNIWFGQNYNGLWFAESVLIDTGNPSETIRMSWRSLKADCTRVFFQTGKTVANMSRAGNRKGLKSLPTKAQLFLPWS